MSSCLHAENLQLRVRNANAIAMQLANGRGDCQPFVVQASAVDATADDGLSGPKVERYCSSTRKVLAVRAERLGAFSAETYCLVSLAQKAAEPMRRESQSKNGVAVILRTDMAGHYEPTESLT